MSDKVSYCSAKPSQIRFSARNADAHTRAYSSLNSTIAHSPLRTHPREGSVDQQINRFASPVRVTETRRLSLAVVAISRAVSIKSSDPKVKVWVYR